MNQDLRVLLYPTKQKIAISLCLAVLWLIFTLSVFSGINSFLFGDKGSVESALAIAANVLVFTLFFYPLACAVGFVYERVVNRTGSDVVTALAAALFIAILNPVSIFLLSYTSQSVVRDYMSEPCGVEVISFIDVNTSLYSGLVDGDVIIGAEGERVDTVASLLHILADKKVGDNVTVSTARGSYTVAMVDHPGIHIPVIGIKGQEKMCRKYF